MNSAAPEPQLVTSFYPTVLRCSVRGKQRATLADVLAMRPTLAKKPTIIEIDTCHTSPILTINIPKKWSDKQKQDIQNSMTWAFNFPLICKYKAGNGLELSFGGIHLHAIAARRVVRTILRGDLEKALML